MTAETGGKPSLTRALVHRLRSIGTGVRRRLATSLGAKEGVLHTNGGRIDRFEDDDLRRGRNVRPGQSAGEIVTPEEQMIWTVALNGGRMRQAEIVEALPWSGSTVSRMLSELEAKDAIERHQIGREKLVCLPRSGPATIESP